MDTPFYRGRVQLDLLTAATVCSCAAWGRPDLAQQAFGAIEPCSVRAYPGPYPLGPDAYLVTSDHYAVVVFPGTGNYYQWIGNVLGSVQLPQPPLPGSVSLYWSSLALDMWNRMGVDLLAALPGRQLVYAGYSLGGAVVQALAARVAVESRDLGRIFTFGSPRVGDPTFAASLAAAQVTRIEATYDPVPGVPPVLWGGLIHPLPFPSPPTLAVYRHAGDGFGLNDSGEVGAETSVLSLGTLNALLSGVNPAQQHSLENYTSLLRRGIDEEALTPGSSGYENPLALDVVLKALEALSGAGWGLPAVPPPPVDGEPRSTRGGGMSIWRATMFFEAGKFGWSESYYRTSDSFGDMSGATDTLAKVRLLLLGTGVKMPSARISDVNLFRDYGLVPLGYDSGPENTDPASHARPTDAIQLNLTSGPYRNRIFLRGFPQSQWQGNNVLTLDSAFQKNLQRLQATILAGQWTMRVQARFAPDAVSGGVVNATNAAPIVITTDAATTLATGDQVRVRGVKGNTAANGLWYINALTATTFQLINSVGNGAYLAGGMWRLSKWIYPNIQQVVALKETSHKTGRPFDSPVGRRRKARSR